MSNKNKLPEHLYKRMMPIAKKVLKEAKRALKLAKHGMTKEEYKSEKTKLK